MLSSLPFVPMTPHRTQWLKTFVLIQMIGIIGAFSCSKQPVAATARDSLAIQFHTCEETSSPSSAKCARVEVPQNYDQATGTKLSIFLKVLPALQERSVQEPVFILAGGPGQAATEIADVMKALIHKTRLHHDVVLVDQRGTGKSHPLNCKLNDQHHVADLFRTDFELDLLKECLDTYQVNPSQFTTDAFVQDLDQVRQSLEYPSISLYGISYGTRAALAYLAKYPNHVNAIVLDGSAPPIMKIPLNFNADGQAALEQLFKDCAQNKSCSDRFPHLRQRFYALLDRLERQPIDVELLHPRKGNREPARITRNAVASITRGALYATFSSTLLPLAIDHAEHGDYQLFAALADMATLTADSIYFGLFLSIICNEDVRWIDIKETNSIEENTLLGSSLIQSLKSACAQWPQSSVKPPMIPNIQDHSPVLLLSGALDPATPPKWAEEIATGLNNHRHIIFSNVGHGTWSTHCGLNLITNFLKNKDLHHLDDRCAAEIDRPAFFLNPLGIYD